MPTGFNIVKNISDAELLELHWQKRMTMQEIANHIGYTHKQSGHYIARAFDKRNIPRRTRSEATKLSHNLHPEKYPTLSGELHPMWKGGRRKHDAGYILVHNPNHPNCHKNRQVFEHRLVMEKKLGRLLRSNEQVHHLNGIRDDNRPENLAVLISSKHERNTFVKVLQSRIRELEQLHLLGL